jgi:hypothetical protein
MTAKQWYRWLMKLREGSSPDVPGSFFLMSGDAIAWLALRLYERQERGIAEQKMEEVEYGPRS